MVANQKAGTTCTVSGFDTISHIKYAKTDFPEKRTIIRTPIKYNTEQSIKSIPPYIPCLFKNI